MGSGLDGGPGSASLGFIMSQAALQWCKNWSQRGDSNPRPAVYETAALPLSYAGPLEV